MRCQAALLLGRAAEVVVANVSPARWLGATFEARASPEFEVVNLLGEGQSELDRAFSCLKLRHRVVVTNRQVWDGVDVLARIGREVRERRPNIAGEAPDGLGIIRGEVDDAVTEPFGPAGSNGERLEPGCEFFEAAVVVCGHQLEDLERIDHGDVRRDAVLSCPVEAGALGCHRVLGVRAYQ